MPATLTAPAVLDPTATIAARAAQFTLGFELEFEWESATVAEQDALYDAAAWWASHGRVGDGSLYDGAEYRSGIKTYAEWRAVAPEFGRWLAQARAAGCRAYATTTAGLHVHLGRAPFTAAELTRVLALPMEAAPRQFKALSMRRSGYRAGCAAEGRIDGDPFSWSSFSQQGHTAASRVAYASEPITDRYTGAPQLRGDPAGRCAVALSYTHPTVEFRLWKGTLGLTGWLLRLGATHAVGHYALTERELSWAGWTAWLHEPAQAELYPEVVAWVARYAARQAERTQG